MPTTSSPDDSMPDAAARATNCQSHDSHTNTIVQMVPAGSWNIFVEDDDDIPSCPSVLDPTLDGYMHQRSTCPWYYVNNYDPYRVPSLILEAACTCSRRKGSLTTEGRNKDNECHRFYVSMPVLRLKEGNSLNEDCLGLDDYELDVENVAVSCVALPDRM